MATSVECLRCGGVRESGRQECQRCGYVGWARSSELTEFVRRMLRERPPELRRIRIV